MATFSFGRRVNINWNGFEVVGPANTVFSLPDQLYEEFEDDFRAVEPSLTWIDTNEFLTLSNSVSVTTLTGTIPISVTSTTSGKVVAISSSTNPAGYYLRADGTGATTWAALPADATGITNVIGTSPISAAVSGTTATISLNASYQTAGTYVTGVVGTSPISATGTTAITVSLNANYQTAGTYVNAVVGTSPASVSTASGTSTVSIVAGSINSTHLSATSVGSSQLIDGSVTSDKLGAASVVAAALAAGAVGSAALAAGAVGSAALAAGSVGSAALAAGAVGSAALASGSVNSSILAANAVVAASISAAAVGTAALSSGAATNGQVLTANGSGAVTYQSPSGGGYWINSNGKIFGSSITSVGAGAYAAINAETGSSIFVISSSSTTVAPGREIRISAFSNLTSIGPVATPHVTWTTRSSNNNLAANTVDGVAFGNGIYIAVSSSTAAVSTDGISWTEYNIGTTGYSPVIAYDSVSSTFYVGRSTYQRLSSSTDGQTWINISVSSQTANSTSNIRAVGTGGGTIVVAGEDNGTRFVFTSTDGINWTSRSTSVGTYFEGIAYSGSLFVLVSQNGHLLTSPDGTTWTSQTSGFGATDIMDVGYGNGLFVTVGGSGNLFTSPDGTTWTTRTSGVGGTLRGVAWNGGWIAVGDSGALTTSPNGTTWTTRTSTFSTRTINAVCRGGPVALAGGASNGGGYNLATSPTQGVDVILIPATYASY